MFNLDEGSIFMKKYLRKWTLNIFLVWFLLNMFGCPKTHQIKSQKNFKISEIDSIIKKALLKGTILKSIEGRAKLRIYYTQKRKRRKTIRLLYQFQHPDRLQIEIEAIMGQPAAIITNDGQHFAIHNILSKEFIHGQSNQLMKYLQEYLPVMMPINELIGILLGRLPIFTAPSRSIRTDKTNQDIAIITFKRKTLTQTLWINTQTNRFIRTIVQKKGQKPITVQYGSFRGKPAFSKQIKFIIPTKGIIVKWIFAELKPKAKIPLKNFKQSIPSGVRVHKISH